MARRFFAFAVGILTVLGHAVADAQTSSLGDGEVYMQINLWAENGRPIPTTNYHKGERIPIGSKVKILASNASQITFSYNGQTLILQKLKHTLVGMDTVKSRTFGTTDPLASKAFSELPEAQQNAVKTGQVIAGMPKAAVLMAYGYPPEHKTPSTGSDLWLYWLDKFRTQSVMFVNDSASVLTGFAETL